MNKMIKIIIVVNDNIVSNGLQRIFDEVIDISVSDIAIDGNDVLEKVINHHPDAIILVDTVSGVYTIDNLKLIKHHFPSIPVLIITHCHDTSFMLRTFKAKSSGYYNYDYEPEELVKAVRKISKGNKYISTEVAELIANHISSDDTEFLHELLSDREYKVFLLLASGKHLPEISKVLDISINTINTYRQRIFKKMKFKSTIELVQYALRNNLVE